MPTETQLWETFDWLVELFIEQRAKQGITARPTPDEVKSFILNFELELQKELDAAGVSTLSELIAKERNQ